MIRFIRDNTKPFKASNRRPIDIYFILYLTALVILLAGRNTDTAQPAAEVSSALEFPFRIKAEKPVLVCKIINDSSGQAVMLMDSVNYILDYGNVTDIQYSFTVEDVQAGQRMNLSALGNETNVFSFKHDRVNRVAVFRWLPSYDLSTISEKTFNVYVNASAAPVGNSHRRMQAQTQFAVLLVDERYTSRSVLGYDVVSDGNYDTGPGASLSYYSGVEPREDISLSADFSLRPHLQVLRGIAGSEWENTVMCYSFSPAKHLVGAPVVEILNSPAANGGTIYGTNIGDNSIVLKGKMPEVGRSTVSISVKRKGDLKEQKVFFDLQPLSIQAADVPKVMYPGIEYSINPALPEGLPGVSSYIKEQSTVRYRSYSNAIIKFSPLAEDVGKTLSFERWLNGNLLGQRYSIKVIDFSSPEITDLSIAGRNKIIIRTITYGLYGDMLNTVKELRLLGNAKYVAIYGKTHKNREKLQSLEQFQIEPADAGKPFAFEVVAVDQLGRVSNSRVYK